MNRHFSKVVLALVLLVPASARAHDASKHKGKAIEGEVVSVANDRFELKTESETIPVTFSSKTKFEHGGQAVTKDHLKTGERIRVIGTKLPTGELVAKEVLMGATQSNKGDMSKMDHGEKSKAGHKH